MSTAQLLTNASCKTAFASQYVATYLSELVTNDAAAGSSRNLSNLSQMFRHLYPQAPRPAHSDSKQSPPLRHPPPPKLLLQTDTEHLVSDPKGSQGVSYPYPAVTRVSLHDAQSASLHLSAKDKRVIADIRSSYGGGGSNGGLHNDSTTSWESFVQPARILPKNSSSSSSDVTGVTKGLKELLLELNQQGSPAAERRGGGLGDGSRLVASGGRRVLIRVEVGGDPGTGGGGNQDGYDLVVSPRRQERPPRESHQPSHEPRGAPLPLSLPTVNKSDGSNVAEQSAEVSKKGSKTPPLFRTKPKRIPEKSVLVDLDSSTGKGRFEKCRESDVRGGSRIVGKGGLINTFPTGGSVREGACHLP
eukprot:Em0003g441a